ncbi:DUF4180 domain-containing protein [Couchioplanes caeruleus]|uniref:DUF4180 domain-containing protein n=1 Tax=Couchioplanes caeruleus TaxID=56438 RepID=UPI0020BE098E|nr:DUF4180 domain-containing protein [Couchioplanes caeruleus]UQU64203.1 DUF4180 domain-containing protein [Couchioplanes caeruleus]
MADQIVERGGVPVLVCDAEGAPIAGPQDALDLIGAAYAGAEVVAIPAERLHASFYRLSTGVAGEIMQKFVNYRIRLAVVGDISAHVAESGALRDLIRETNKGKQVWFVKDFQELDERLG